MDRIIETLARELGKDPRHVENVVRLLDEGSTVPFIARYRKELHGAMDDTALRTLEERLSRLCYQVQQLAQQQVHYGLLLGHQRIAPGSGEAHQTTCLTALALYENS